MTRQLVKAPRLSFDTRLLWTVMNWHGERYYGARHPPRHTSSDAAAA